LLTPVQPFQVSNSLDAAPFRDRGRFFPDFSRENADNYCLNERNPFAGKLTRFLKNARGGVAPLMAVVAVPVMGAVGMAVDYTRVNAARTAFQVALDSTALMMSKDAATKTDAERQTEATKTFSALFNRPEVTDATVTPVFHRGRSTWGNTRLRVALVLDDTGSMANDGKMDALKIASRNLQSGRSERTGHH